jgi:phosphoglycolate phosphatase
MYIVSNCQEGYIETFLHYHRLETYFKDFESHGRTKLSKGENIRLVMMRNHIEEAVYIGDTRGDMEAAEQAGIPFIFAAYGFGKIGEGETQWAIQKTNELLEVVNSIL